MLDVRLAGHDDHAGRAVDARAEVFSSSPVSVDAKAERRPLGGLQPRDDRLADKLLVDWAGVDEAVVDEPASAAGNAVRLGLVDPDPVPFVQPAIK